MSLPHVLLGFLSLEPRTGYELARAIERELAPAWKAEFSQIYPALAGMRRAGLAHLRVLGPRRGPRRNLYRITAAGRRELKKWLTGPFALRGGRDEALARFALLEALPPPERRLAALRYERALVEESRRLKALPPLPGLRGRARRIVLERLEASRRLVAALRDEGLAFGGAEPVPAKKR
jgi:DNA-binding PadR family transcriptional regulator